MRLGRVFLVYRFLKAGVIDFTNYWPRIVSTMFVSDPEGVVGAKGSVAVGILARAFMAPTICPLFELAKLIHGQICPSR
jgi:hypothetical protein